MTRLDFRPTGCASLCRPPAEASSPWKKKLRNAFFSRPKPAPSYSLPSCFGGVAIAACRLSTLPRNTDIDMPPLLATRNHLAIPPTWDDIVIDFVPCLPGPVLSSGRLLAKVGLLRSQPLTDSLCPHVPGHFHLFVTSHGTRHRRSHPLSPRLPAFVSTTARMRFQIGDGLRRTIPIPKTPGFVSVAFAFGLITNPISAIEDDSKQNATSIVLSIRFSLIGQECELASKMQCPLDMCVSTKSHDTPASFCYGSRARRDCLYSARSIPGATNGQNTAKPRGNVRKTRKKSEEDLTVCLTDGALLTTLGAEGEAKGRQTWD